MTKIIINIPTLRHIDIFSRTNRLMRQRKCLSGEGRIQHRIDIVDSFQPNWELLSFIILFSIARWFEYIGKYVRRNINMSPFRSSSRHGSQDCVNWTEHWAYTVNFFTILIDFFLLVLLSILESTFCGQNITLCFIYHLLFSFTVHSYSVVVRLLLFLIELFNEFIVVPKNRSYSLLDSNKNWIKE